MNYKMSVGLSELGQQLGHFLKDGRQTRMAGEMMSIPSNSFPAVAVIKKLIRNNFGKEELYPRRRKSYC